MNNNKFTNVFPDSKPLIAMIHVQALPGTPKNSLTVNQIAEQASKEARILSESGVQAIMLENMHDVPYLNRDVGPEIIAALTRIASEVRAVSNLPLGIQVLAGANKAALSIALASDLQFVRTEGFVFAHLADEGFMQSDAGELLRFRKTIGAEHIQVFTDVKKKHSSHAMTGDVPLVDTVETAEFFLSDGVIITGTHTGKAVDKQELQSVYDAANCPVLVGSGVTPEGLPSIWEYADAFIVGSYFKKNGNWENEPDPKRLALLLKSRVELL